MIEVRGLTKRHGDTGYSLGMRQRLGIAAVLLGDPAVLLFDEPVNGLDADGVRWVRHLVRGLAAEGRTVLVSSHLLSEVHRRHPQQRPVGPQRGILPAARTLVPVISVTACAVVVSAATDLVAWASWVPPPRSSLVTSRPGSAGSRSWSPSVACSPLDSVCSCAAPPAPSPRSSCSSSPCPSPGQHGRAVAHHHQRSPSRPGHRRPRRDRRGGAGSEHERHRDDRVDGCRRGRRWLVTDPPRHDMTPRTARHAPSRPAHRQNRLLQRKESS